MRGMHDKKLISDSFMDEATTALKSARAALESAVAGLDQAREQMQYTEVRAPYSGLVTRRFLEIGVLRNKLHGSRLTPRPWRATESI